MAKNNLKQILISEGLKQAEFIKRTNLDVSTGTFNRLANCRRAVSRVTQNKILLALNGLLNNKYTYEDVFPPNEN